MGLRLTPLEKEMFAAAATGGLVDRGEGPFRPAEMRSWGRDRTVRAEALRCLLVGTAPVAAKGVQLRGVAIQGPLDLEAATVSCPLRLDACYLTGPRPNFRFAAVSLLELKNCHLDGLTAESIVVSKDLDLSGSTFTGPIELPGADISGWFVCTDAKLNGKNQDNYSMIAYALKVGGSLDLDKGFTAAGAITLMGADITGQLDCDGAHIDGKDGQGRSLLADRIKVGRAVHLSNGFTAAGAIRFAGAYITSQFTCHGAQLNGKDAQGNALTAFTMSVGGDLILEKPFKAVGAIEIYGSNIAGRLRCKGAKLHGKNDADDTALIASRMKVGSDVQLDRVSTTTGGLRLMGTAIGGQLSCRGARLDGMDKEGNALCADSVSVGGRVIIDNGFTAAGTVRLPGASITGRLRCRHAAMRGKDKHGRALLVDQITVGGGVVLGDVCTSQGAISMVGADITGDLRCDNVRLQGADAEDNALIADSLKVRDRLIIYRLSTTAGAVRLPGAAVAGRFQLGNAKLKGADKNGRALLADGMRVGGGMWLGGVRTTRGAIRMVGADITGDLRCNGVRLKGVDLHGRALVADRISVSGSLFVDLGKPAYSKPESIAEGAVSLRSAYVGSSLRLKPAELAGGKDAAGKQKIALDLRGARITHDLDWDPGQAVTGEVILEDAKVGQIKDDLDHPNGYWPSASSGLLRLDGLTYNRICDQRGAMLQKRLEWIGSLYKRSAKNEGRAFTTQPYEQLARVYRQAGQDTEARKVAIARRRDLRRYGDLTVYRKFGNWLLDITIRYGYRTWRAVALLVILYCAAAAIFVIARHQPNLIIPITGGKNPTPTPTAMQCTSNFPCFHPFAYTFDTVIPIINVRQAMYWTSNGQAPWGYVLGGFTWVSTVLGWILATLAVAGYTGLVRRD